MENALPIVIVGHIDHGKSTLIGRLLFDTDSLSSEIVEKVIYRCQERQEDVHFAHVMDQLEEEQNKSITIETSQTFFKTEKRQYVIIDAPGHKQYINNMITGAAQADAAILVVDVTENIKEQTRRHLVILKLLGIRSIIVVVNKMDCVDYKKSAFDSVKRSILDFFETIGHQLLRIIPISAQLGDNIVFPSEVIAWYDDEPLVNVLDTLDIKQDMDNRPLRFPIQDVYEKDGKKIAVGRIESGSMYTGQNVFIFSPKARNRIISIEVLAQTLNSAQTGKSVGVVMENDLLLERGMVICSEKNTPRVANSVWADAFWTFDKPLKKGDWLIFRCVTQQTDCCVEKIDRIINTASLEVMRRDSIDLEETEIGRIFLKMNTPVIIDPFQEIPPLGRFVLERDNEVLAVGICHLEE